MSKIQAMLVFLAFTLVIGADGFAAQDPPAAKDGSEPPAICSSPLSETAVHFGYKGTNDLFPERDHCTAEHDEEIKSAVSVVKRYWTPPYGDQYALFTGPYRDLLKRVYKVSGAKDYSKKIDPELFWVKQEYRKVEVGATHATVTLLSFWFQEGYEGERSFVFELIKEGDHWMIGSIIY